MKRILLRKKGQYKLEKIRETFRNYFDGKVELPENIGEKGEIQGEEIREKIMTIIILMTMKVCIIGKTILIL